MKQHLFTYPIPGYPFALNERTNKNGDIIHRFNLRYDDKEKDYYLVPRITGRPSNRFYTHNKTYTAKSKNEVWQQLKTGLTASRFQIRRNMWLITVPVVGAVVNQE